MMKTVLFRAYVLIALLALSSPALQAHEFWIDPLAYQVLPGEPVVAQLRVGQEFRGAPQIYLPNRFRQFDYALGDEVLAVEGRAGDRPAMNITVDGGGLLSVVHVTQDSTLTYRGLEKFENFVTHKDATWTLEAHKDASFPVDSFVEVYSRYAKSLIAVGSGEGADREFGLETELVALGNPYIDDLPEGLRVQLLYLGEPRPDAQIEVFEKVGEDVTIFTVRTDARGLATVPVRSGSAYMLDAVVLRSPLPQVAETTGAVWESLWANLTFAVP